MYTKIEDLTFYGIYDGYVENLKATNNHIEIYIHTSYSENLELIKINLNLDWIKQEDKKMLMQFLAKGVSINTCDESRVKQMLLELVCNCQFIFIKCDFPGMQFIK